MKKAYIFTVSFLLLLSLPAVAQLGNIWTDFQSYSVDLQNYLKYNLNSTLKSVEPQARNALNDSTGDLNIPSPVGAGKMIENDMTLNFIPDYFENNSAIKSNSVSHEINRLMTRSSLDGFIGRSGQTRLKNKLEDTERTLDNINQSVNEADKNSQNFLDKFPDIATKLLTDPMVALANSQANLQLQSIKIQRDQARMMGEIVGQNIQGNQFLLYSNLNLANISQQIEDSNRARRVESSAEAALLLRSTSQVDLFGRNVGSGQQSIVNSQ